MSREGLIVSYLRIWLLLGGVQNFTVYNNNRDHNIIIVNNHTWIDNNLQFSAHSISR